MFQLLFKNSIRHLKRNKLFTFLNILGLTIGISSCWGIFKFTNYELSYENSLANHEHIYRIVSRLKFEDKAENWNGGISRPIYSALRDDVRGLDQVVPVFQSYISNVSIPSENGQLKRLEEFNFFDSQIINTEESYFDMISYRWLAGKKEGSLSNPNQVILTQERAQFYFPNVAYEDIIGKSLLYSDSVQRNVSGIVANLEYPTEFKAQEFFLLQNREEDNTISAWTNTSGSDRVYIQAKDEESLRSAYNQISNIVEVKFQQYKQEIKPTFKFARNLEIMPLKDSHFSTYIKEWGMEKVSKNLIYGLIGVSIFLLIIACINYINISTAQIPQRAKEIGIRKTLGGSKYSLIVQMMIETFIIISIAIIASYFTSKLGFYILGDLISQQVRDYNNPLVFGVFIMVVLIFTLLFAGLYPSWLVSRVNAIDIFRNKGHMANGRGNLNLRKVLIIFQFVIAQIFIVAAIIIGQQLRYTVQKDLGFNKEAVALIDIPFKLSDQDNFSTKKKTLAVELEKIPGIKQVSLGQQPLANGANSTMMEYYPEEYTEPIVQLLYKKEVDDKYLDFYQLQLLAGNNLSVSDTNNGFVINETALRAFGFKNPQAAIGKIIGQKGRTFPIVGVINDFHAKTFYTAIEPMALISGPNSNTYNIRFAASDLRDSQTILAHVKREWSQFFPTADFNYTFIEDAIFDLYKKEQQLQKITNISTSIAIILSCLGLFGLTTISAFQRTKEIGVRKVLGASISGIVSLLSKDFIKMVSIAILIASPIVWWLCGRWLNDFVYRIEISWLPFIFGGLIAMISALITIGYQAIKAAKVNPAESLRDE